MSGPDGLLLVDKPAGWTSHDVVARVRRLARTRRVGHAGPLDPMATGVLVLGVGRGTKLLTFLVGCDKAYAATVRLGQATVTDDADGEVTASADPAVVAALTPERIAAEVARLTGPIHQVPSAVSAIKVNGRRAYARVRGGEQVVLAPRPVVVSRFEVRDRRQVTLSCPDDTTSPAPDGTADRLSVLDLEVEVEVSSGTYVRALARDLGAALGVGGHLTALRRTRVGGYHVADCHSMAALAEVAELPELPELPESTPVAEASGTATPGQPAVGGGHGGIPILGLAAAARAALASRELSAQEALALGHGRPIASAQPGRAAPVAAFGPDGRLVAVLDETGARTRAHVVFEPVTGDGPAQTAVTSTSRDA